MIVTKKSDGTAYLVDGGKITAIHGSAHAPGTPVMAVDDTTFANLVAAFGAVNTGAPAANFTSAQGAGHTRNFTDTSTNTPTSWAWTFGDGQTSTLQNPSPTYAAAGSYTVTLIATNAKGSSAPKAVVTVVA